MFGAVEIGRNRLDPVSIGAVTGRATADVNNPYPLRHEIFGADLFTVLVSLASVIFRILAGAAIENAGAGADDQQIPP